MEIDVVAINIFSVQIKTFPLSSGFIVIPVLKAVFRSNLLVCLVFHDKIHLEATLIFFDATLLVKQTKVHHHLILQCEAVNPKISRHS